MFLENVLNVKNEWWRYFLGCIIIFIGTQLGSIPFVIAIFSKIGAEGASKIDQTSMMYVLEDSNLTLFYFLYTEKKNILLKRIWIFSDDSLFE